MNCEYISTNRNGTKKRIQIKKNNFINWNTHIEEWERELEMATMRFAINTVCKGGFNIHTQQTKKIWLIDINYLKARTTNVENINSPGVHP